MKGKCKENGSDGGKISLQVTLHLIVEGSNFWWHSASDRETRKLY